MLICILPRISWLSGALNFIGLRFCNRCARQPAARSQVLSDQPPTPPVNFSDNFPNWEWFNSETERLQFVRCRNLSLIVPLYGLDGSRLKTEFIICSADVYANAASNETYSDSWSMFSVLPWMRGPTALIKASGARGLSRNGDYAQTKRFLID